MSYGNGMACLYKFNDVTFDTAFEEFIKGPAGAEGRVLSISSVIKIDTTGDVTLIEVGTQADPDAYAEHTVPIGVAEISQNAMVRQAVDVIPADSLVTVAGDAGATAGDGDLCVLIYWYGGDAS